MHLAPRWFDLGRQLAGPTERALRRARDPITRLGLPQLGWRLAETTPDDLLSSRGWFELRSEQYLFQGAHVVLETSLAGGATVALRDLWLPGWGRWWILMGEPRCAGPRREVMASLLALARALAIRRVSLEGVMSDLRPEDVDPT